MGFTELPKEFFGNHYERARRNYELATAREKINFQQKYPYANVDDFFFDADIARNGDVVGTAVKYRKVRSLPDITGYIFRKNYEDALYWQPRIWGPEGTVQKFVANTSPFPYAVTKFGIYVTEGTRDEYFPSNFQDLDIAWKGAEKDIRKASVDENDPYFCSLLSACVISHVGGISRKHLQEDASTPKIVTSIARYCVYYHLGRFLKDPSKLGPYLTEDLRDLVKSNLRVRKVWERKFVRTKENISLWYSQQENKKNIRNYRYVSGSVFSGVLGIEYEEIDHVLPHDAETDWMSFVKESSDGLTKTGQKLLQMAIESYVYAVLGSQARTRWPIVGQGAKSLQTQDIFHVLVRDSIVQDDPVKNISNMRTAIENTNVVLNLVVCPGIILVPSSMIILKKRVEGYNNYLTLATKDMKFGVNEDVNRVAKPPKPSYDKLSHNENEGVPPRSLVGKKIPSTERSEAACYRRWAVRLPRDS